MHYCRKGLDEKLSLTTFLATLENSELPVQTAAELEFSGGKYLCG